MTDFDANSSSDLFENGCDKPAAKPRAASHVASPQQRARRKKNSTTAVVGQNDLERSLPELSFFGPKALLNGESEEGYNAVWRQVRDAALPTDFIEEMWVRDVVDALWETLRLRRMKVELLNASRWEGLQAILVQTRSILDGSSADLVMSWASRDAGALKKVHEHLQKLGLNDAAIDAHTLTANLDKLEKLDIMLLRADARRNSALQEMHRRKEFKARVQQALQDVQDAEFEDVTPPSHVEAAE